MQERFTNPDYPEVVEPQTRWRNYVQREIDNLVAAGCTNTYTTPVYFKPLSEKDIEREWYKPEDHAPHKGKVWGFTNGNPVRPEVMSMFTGEQNVLTEPRIGDISVMLHATKPDGGQNYVERNLGMPTDIDMLAVTPGMSFTNVEFIGEGTDVTGYRVGKKGPYFKLQHFPDKFDPRSKNWKPVAGDKYDIITTGVAGKNGGVEFCIPVRCTRDRRKSDEEYARRREDAKSRGMRLLRFNNYTAVDDGTGEVYFADWHQNMKHLSDYRDDKRSVQLEVLSEGGKSAWNDFWKNQLVEIPESLFQELAAVTMEGRRKTQELLAKEEAEKSGKKQFS